jgi:hypothetical protein
VIAPAALQLHCSAQSEPGVYRIADLYRSADQVALVKVLSGDTESYEDAVYKGQVLKAFKGVSAKVTLYFGPFDGMKLGSEYLLFLKKQQAALKPKQDGHGYGAVQYSKIFNEGYSSMLISYECVFDGNSPRESCQDAVRVCTDYIKLPKGVKTTPPESNDPPFGCRWVKRDQFISILEELGHGTD